MSCRVDTASLIAGACVVGYRGLGVLGSQVPSTGEHGPGYLFNDLDLPADANKEVRGYIETMPVGLSSFFAWEDSSFEAAGPDGEYSFTYRLFVDGVDLGTAVESISIGAGIADLAGNAAAAASASAGLSLLKPLLGAAAVGSEVAAGLQHGVPLEGAATGLAGAAASLQGPVALDGAAVAQLSASAALTATGPLRLAAAQVIDALALRLAAMTSLASPLQTTREDGVTPAELPAAWLWGERESAELVSQEGLHEHRLDITLRIVVSALAHVDDAMNTIGAQAMALLFAEPVPFDLEHTGTDREAATRGAIRCGVITVGARATFHVYPSEPHVLV